MSIGLSLQSGVVHGAGRRLRVAVPATRVAPTSHASVVDFEISDG